VARRWCAKEVSIPGTRGVGGGGRSSTAHESRVATVASHRYASDRPPPFALRSPPLLSTPNLRLIRNIANFMFFFSIELIEYSRGWHRSFEISD
jgi:hypothetical protein